MDIEEVIKLTVDTTIDKLMSEGLFDPSKSTTYYKTEELLRNYKRLKASDHGPTTRKVIKKLNDALAMIEQDPMSKIIRLYYIEGVTRDGVAKIMNIQPTTVSRNKRRLVNELKVMLFSDEFVRSLYS